jgi:hypothetical protein
MGGEVQALTSAGEPVLPRTTIGVLVACWASAAVLVIPGGEYRVVALSVAWVPFLIFQPKAGLWFAPALMMAASILAPPAGFEWGVGYSPELIFWATASCVALVATLVACYRLRSKISTKRIGLPVPFYAFAAISIVGTIVGFRRGYPLTNVAKQFYGCLLFLAYFWFAVEIAPKVVDIKRVIRAIAAATALFCAVYVVQHLWTHKDVHLTILSDYSGSLAALLLPELLPGKNRGSRKKLLAMMILFLSVPILAEFKRSIAGFVICAVLLIGLRSATRLRRYTWLLAGFLIFSILLATPILDYVGDAVAKEPILSGLVPQNVQSNYSVYLRLVESEQMLATTGISALGTGLGSTLSWYDPYAHVTWTQETVDIGWVYLLIKLGVVGLAVFVWLIGSLLVRALREVPKGIHLGLALVVVFFTIDMIAGFAFVYFMSAMWAGASCGWLHVLNNRTEFPSAAQEA